MGEHEQDLHIIMNNLTIRGRNLHLLLGGLVIVALQKCSSVLTVQYKVRGFGRATSNVGSARNQLAPKKAASCALQRSSFAMPPFIRSSTPLHGCTVEDDCLIGEFMSSG